MFASRAPALMFHLCGLLAAIAFPSGCRTSRPDDALTTPLASTQNPALINDTSAVVRPGMELEWSVQSPIKQAGHIQAGASSVGIDGTIAVGPYGTCRVAGLTLAQAGSEVEKHLSAYVNRPQVAMRSARTSPEAVDIAWTKSPETPAIAQAPILGPPAIRPAEPRTRD